MKSGFQSEIATNLDLDQMKIATEFANKWISDVVKNNLSWKDSTQGGWKSFYKRGIAGLKLENGLYFRRASKSRRIFHIVKGEDLVIKPQVMKHGSEHDGKLGTKCMCPGHEGGLVVENKYGDIETTLYARIGSIKG